MKLAMAKMMSCLFIRGSKGKGMMSALTPKTIKMFKMLEPKTLPMAMPEFFFVAATIDVMSSGKEVAVATTVRPMVLSLMPQLRANICALLETSGNEFASSIQPCNAHNELQYGLAPRQGFLRFLGFRFRRLFQHGERKIGASAEEQNDSFDPVDIDNLVFAHEEIVGHQGDDEGGEEACRDVAADGNAAHVDRPDERTHTEDEQNVHRVASDDVAYGQARTAFGAREHIHNHFRQRSAESHDGQADDERRQFGADAHARCPVDEPVRTQYQGYETENQ